MIADSLATLRQATARGLVIVRADSTYCRHDAVAAATKDGARFSVTARLNLTAVKAIAGIDGQTWTAIRCPNAIIDAEQQRWDPRCRGCRPRNRLRV